MQIIVIDELGNKRTYSIEDILANLHNTQELFEICASCGRAVVHGQIYDEGDCLQCTISRQKLEQGR